MIAGFSFVDRTSYLNPALIPPKIFHWEPSLIQVWVTRDDRLIAGPEAEATVRCRM